MWNEKKQGHLGLPVCVCVCLCFGAAAQNAKPRVASQTPREGTLILISLLLSFFPRLSGACWGSFFTGLSRLVSPPPPPPPSHANRAALNDDCVAGNTHALKQPCELESPSLGFLFVLRMDTHFFPYAWCVTTSSKSAKSNSFLGFRPNLNNTQRHCHSFNYAVRLLYSRVRYWTYVTL